MNEDLEELLKKELEARETERKKQEEDARKKQEEIAKFNKTTTKIVIWVVVIAFIVGVIISFVIGSQPSDYEYKLIHYESLQYDETKGIVDIEIKNNTNKKKYCYIQIRVYDKDDFMIAWSEAAFIPQPKSTDTYQMTVQSISGYSLRGSSVEISSFNVIDI